MYTLSECVYNVYLPKHVRFCLAKHSLNVYAALVYIMLFSYFCVAWENNQFCYYIFLYNTFDFSHEDRSMCKSYMICDVWKNGSTHFSFSPLSWFVIRENVCYMFIVLGALEVHWTLNTLTLTWRLGMPKIGNSWNRFLPIFQPEKSI